ncbi:MAG: hypothetical protein JRI23_26135 [Deltaproteobacteria bacterium]|nr:hypothetical protein [Deltaproteobacteria bacterium]
MVFPGASRFGWALACLVLGSMSFGACKCAKADTSHIVTTADGCRHKSKWSKRRDNDCVHCVSLAPAPPGCEEQSRRYSALCADQQRARLDAKQCEPVFFCAAKCKLTDCDCVAKCYEGHAECDQLSAALDRCLVEVCEPYCAGDQQ